MATNFIQEGDTWNFTNTGSAISSGAPVLIPGYGYGVAATDIAATTGTGSVFTKGVFEFSAASADTWSQGARLYWDAAQGTAGEVNTDEANVFIGRAFTAKANGETKVHVKLMPFDYVDGAIYNIALDQLFFHDAWTRLPSGDGTNDDLGVTVGTAGTAHPILRGIDSGGTTGTSKGRFQFMLPAEYTAGATITLRAKNAGMQVVSDGTATLDVEAWSQDMDGTVSSDLCSTDAQSINSATLADFDFTITPTGLVAGDMLDIVLTTAVTDSGNASANITAIISGLQIILG